LSPPSEFLSPTLIGSSARIEDPEPLKEWRPGDTVVYGITMRSPKGFRRWLIRIRVHSYPADLSLADDPSVSITPLSIVGGASREATPVLLAVETSDETGQSLHASHVPVPADDFEHGFYPGCLVGVTEELIVASRLLTDEEARAVERSMAVFNSLFRLANLELKPILDAVVAPPPILKVLLHGGYVHLTIGSGFVGATEPVHGFAGVSDPVYSFPFEVQAYESPALRGRIFVTDSRPPFLPAAGIVAIEAVHPDDPASTVSVRLLSATRGPRDDHSK